MSKTSKKTVSFHMDTSVVERLRDAVFYTPGLCMGDAVEAGIDRILNELEEMRGEPFPRRRGAVKLGCPIL